MVSMGNVGLRVPPPPLARDEHAARGEHVIGAHCLADEHAALIHEVRNRKRAALGALGAGRWPDREVDGLVEYLRYEVLDQAVTTERLLYPLIGDGHADARIHALVGDHLHLRELTDQLATVVATNGPRRELKDLVELLDALDEFLEEHMRAEAELLSATTSAGVESLRRPFRCHQWFTVTEGPEVDLDALPREFVHRAALERFSRLRLGERLLVQSSCDLDGLWHLLSCGRPGEYGWTCLEEGPNRWRAEVSRRAPE